MLNKVILMGRLTADPELRQTASGIANCRFNVAINRNYKSKDTNETKADFIQCQAWRQTADFIGKYFSKGKLIVVEGMLQNNNYEKDGVKHYGYVVGVQKVSFGEGKNSSNGGQQGYLPPSDSKAVTLDDDVDLSEFEELDDGNVPF